MTDCEQAIQGRSFRRDAQRLVEDALEELMDGPVCSVVRFREGWKVEATRGTETGYNIHLSFVGHVGNS